MDNFKSANDCPKLFPIEEGRNNLTFWEPKVAITVPSYQKYNLVKFTNI